MTDTAQIKMFRFVCQRLKELERQVEELQEKLLLGPLNLTQPKYRGRNTND